MKVKQETSVPGWDVFPEGWPRRVFDLIVEAWPQVIVGNRGELEENITGLLHTALMDIWFSLHKKDWFPTLEQPCVDSAGNYVGFTDLRFVIFTAPPARCVFVVENKRLNVAGEVQRYAVRYAEDGMARFVSGRYSPDMPCGGMVGFVMDGDCQAAYRQLQNTIGARREILGMQNNARWTGDLSLPCYPNNGKTDHRRANGTIRLFHIMLPLNLHQS